MVVLNRDNKFLKKPPTVYSHSFFLYLQVCIIRQFIKWSRIFSCLLNQCAKKKRTKFMQQQSIEYLLYKDLFSFSPCSAGPKRYIIKNVFFISYFTYNYKYKKIIKVLKIIILNKNNLNFNKIKRI